MATITLEYDGRNKLMQDLIALLEKYGANARLKKRKMIPLMPHWKLLRK